MEDLERRLADYYDREGESRLQERLDSRRIAARTRFVELLRDESRHDLLEVGSGPGRDAIAFADAGIDVLAVDRSGGHARLAAAQGIRAVQASVLHLPVRAASFAAGWTMSTLVHIPDDRFDEAMGAITSSLRPGAPLAVGLWGGFDHEGWWPARDDLPSRFFSHRSHQRAREMLARHGAVDHFTTWADDRSDWQYQFAILRSGAGRASG
ncbi:MAG: class I SAM-dependent methyltransferase [Ilumatobacteraceae bacterium]